MNTWSIVSSKKKKELLYNLKRKYIGKTLIGKFNKNKNIDYVSDIINNKEIKNIYLINNIKCFIIGDIIEIKITDIKETNEEFIYYGEYCNVIRRKFHRLFGIVYKFDYQYYYIYSNILGKKYIIKTTNSKNLNLLDKVIFEIQNYQNQNNIFVKILYILGSLKNNEEIFDSILIEENFIDCNNLVPLLNNVNNINELVNKKGVNFYDKLINKSNDVFFNMEDLTNFENIQNLDNFQFNKNYDKEQLINTKIDYKLKNENLTFNALYHSNNLFIYKYNNQKSLQIGFLVDYFIGNREIYNSGKQLFYRNLYTEGLTNINNENFLNNDFSKYYQTYNNNKKKEDFINLLNNKKQHKLWIIDINTEKNIINNFSFHHVNINMIDKLDDNFKINVLNMKTNLFKYYYQKFNKDNFYINIIYSKLKYLLINNIKKNVDYIPIRKINKYEYVNLDKNSYNNNTNNNNSNNSNSNNNININNSFNYLNNINTESNTNNVNISQLLKTIEKSSIKDIKRILKLDISYSNIVSFNKDIFLEQINDYYNENKCLYKKIYDKLFDNNIKFDNIYKPKNIYLIKIEDLDNMNNIDEFFNPYNDFFDSYILKLILKIKTTNISKINLKENYDNNIFKILENCNISEKICYKVEQRIHYYLLFNELKNNDIKKITGKIIYKKNNSLFVDLNINNFHYILNTYDMDNNYNNNENISLILHNYDIVKKEIFINL